MEICYQACQHSMVGNVRVFLFFTNTDMTDVIEK